MGCSVYLLGDIKKKSRRVVLSCRGGICCIPTDLGTAKQRLLCPSLTAPNCALLSAPLNASKLKEPAQFAVKTGYLQPSPLPGG